MYWTQAVVALIFSSVALLGISTNPHPECADPFKSVYCFNGGTCLVTLGEMICQCERGFMGIRCDQKYMDDKFTTQMSEQPNQKIIPTESDANPSKGLSIVTAVLLSILVVLMMLCIVGVCLRNTINQLFEAIMPM